MSHVLRGSWHVDAKGAERPERPPAQDAKEVTLPSLGLGDLQAGIAELKLHINAQLTIWKDALEGPGEAANAEDDGDDGDSV